MTENKNRYKVKIGDKTYTIIGKESKYHMDIVTEVANEQLTQIMSLSPNIDLEQASVLLAINAVSDQLNKEEKAIIMEKELKELREKVKRVAELESRLKRYDEMERDAKKTLVSSGKITEAMSPSEVQRLKNQQVIEKIQKNADKADKLDKEESKETEETGKKVKKVTKKSKTKS
ncbi:cell division protein ZapA [Vagococcus intermedius]|uniref:Cell division protein ZapA n=1 Tax=Vagococcus intermedius TaxID=2991418 RepID=A0AAF0CVQ8_9ENTE|nr:cell division protein ZapA [Vagococcus intermedius]WEG73744.1 cell division protein ZapA [Vagococcus intermedius]WEG75829.1 cell division protein ZapA [Vagococcus intermedius]